MLTIWKTISFQTEKNTRRKLAKNGLVNKHHSVVHLIQIDLLNYPRWRANSEAKQECFQLDRYRPFVFQHGNQANS